ncbi:hypothetical protein N181_31210 [Sinorhizobium fredii USDA 205]|nr:hypothetical protein N181_31210 [Sinorhizobium fredii USDA 205]
MVIGTCVAKQRNARELFIFDKYLGDLMLRVPRNGLQPRRSVKMYNCRNFVLPRHLRLVIEQHVWIGRSGTKYIRCTVLQTYWRNWPEVFAEFDFVKMIFHFRRGRSRQNASSSQCPWSKLAAPGKENHGFVAGEDGGHFRDAARASMPPSWYFACLQARAAVD